MRRIEVKPGDKYNKLTIIKEVYPHIKPNGQKQRKFLVQCDCGSEPFEATLGNLRSGHTTSCGCYQKEKTKEASKKYNTYDLSGEYGIGYTSKNEPFYFDKEDYQKIKEYTWYLDKDGYVATKVNNKTIRFHRLIMNCPEGMDIDHRFHRKNDNRKSQLREVTRSQNLMNRRVLKNSTSGVTGVSWSKARNKWRTRIGVSGKEIYLGYYKTLEEAIKVRKDAEIKYFGEFRNQTA